MNKAGSDQHTHAHAHANAHVNAHAHAHAPKYRRTDVRMYRPPPAPHTHTPTHAHAHAHAHAHMHMQRERVRQFARARTRERKFGSGDGVCVCWRRRPRVCGRLTHADTVAALTTSSCCAICSSVGNGLPTATIWGVGPHCHHQPSCPDSPPLRKAAVGRYNQIKGHSHPRTLHGIIRSRGTLTHVHCMV